MVLATFVAVITVLCVFLAGHLFGISREDLYLRYYLTLRSNFFTGFLTVGSFMLSLKTFIVVKLKESVFDSESYKKTFDEQSHRFSDARTEYYRPLRNLSSLLFFTIASAITTAVIHVTIGLFGGWFPFVVCVFSVGFSFVMVLLSLYLIHLNIYTWLEKSKDPKPPEAKADKKVLETPDADVDTISKPL